MVTYMKQWCAVKHADTSTINTHPRNAQGMAESHPELPSCKTLCSQRYVTCTVGRSYLTSIGPLHISFFATQVLLWRGLMFPATRAAKVTPGSNLQRWLSTALAEFELFTTFMSYITEEELTSFWGRCKFLTPNPRHCLVLTHSSCPITTHPLWKLLDLPLPTSQ
jgi:hypothetical protein